MGEKMENQVLEAAVFQKVLKNIPLGLIVSREGRQRKVYYVNQTAYEMMEYSEEEYIALVERGWTNFMDVDLKKVLRDNHEQIRSGKPFEVLAKTKTKSGKEKWILNRIVVHLQDGTNCYICFFDVTDKIETEQRRRQEEEDLREQASRDSFTKLYNRGTMEDLVEEELSSKKEMQYAYVSLDVDNFKQINDTYGHEMGDMLILEVSKLLKHEFSENAVVARMGGDEFSVFVSDVKDREVIFQKAANVLTGIRKQKDEMGLMTEPTLSIGIAFTPEGGANFREMYHRADEALYHVKNEEKNGICVHHFS